MKQSIPWFNAWRPTRASSGRRRASRHAGRAPLVAERLEDRRVLAVGWATAAGGPGEDRGHAVAASADGSAFVTGSFEGSATFGGTTLSSEGLRDCFIAKVDANGSYAWAVRAGGSGRDSGLRVTALADGSAIVAGTFSGTATFGATTLVAAGWEDIFVAKVSASGGFLWAVRGGGSAWDDYPAAISVLADGSVFLTGWFSDVAMFGSTSLVGNGNTIFVAKVAASGTFAWAVTASGGRDSVTGYGIATTSDGSAIVTGQFSGTVSFGGTTLTSAGLGDCFIAQVNASGSYAWAVRAGGSGDDKGSGVAVLADGSAVVTGSFSGTAAFGGNSFTSSGKSDVFVTIVNPTGGFGFATRVGGTGDDAGGGISVAADGSLVMTGVFQGTVWVGSAWFIAKNYWDGFVARLDPVSRSVSWARQFDNAVSIAATPGGALLVTGGFQYLRIGGDEFTSLGGSDAFVARLDPDGTYAHAVRPGGAPAGTGSAVAALADGSAIVTGSFSGVRTFGGTTLTSVGGSDAFVARLNPDGTYAWAVRGGGSGDEYGSEVAVLADGSAVVVGGFNASSTFGATTLTSAESGTDNVFVARLSAGGSFVWATRIGGSGPSYVSGVALLADGSPLVAGRFLNRLTLGGTTLTSVGSWDAFVAKLDPNGSHAWAVRAGGFAEDLVEGITAFADGSAVITGTFRDSASFGNAVLSHSHSAESYSPAFVARLNAAGRFTWATVLRGTVFPKAIAANADGSAVVAGTFHNGLTVGATTLDAGFGEIFAARLDSGGNTSWVVQAGDEEPGGEGALAVATQVDGSVILAGYFSRWAKFGRTILQSAGSTDIFVAKLYADGSHAWVTRAGGPGADSARGVAVGGDGAVIMTGDFEETATFGGITLSENLPRDMFFAKLRVSDFVSSGVKLGAVELGRIPAGYALRVSGRVIPVTTDGGHARPGVWVAVAGRQSGAGYELLWKNPSGGQFVAWALNAAGRFTVARPVTVAEVRGLEGQAGADLDGDGSIGPPFTSSGVTVGAVEFGRIPAGYAVRVNGRVIPVTWAGRSASPSWPGGGLVAQAARESGTGYEVFWRNPITKAHMMWTLNAAGARTASAALTLATVQRIETQIARDLTGDGVVGAPAPKPPPSPLPSPVAWANGKWDAFPSAGQATGTPGVRDSGSTDIGNTIGSGRRYLIQGSTVTVYREKYPIEGGGGLGNPLSGLVQVGSGSVVTTSVNGKPAVRLTMTDRNENNQTIRVTITLVRTDSTRSSGWRFSELKGSAMASDGFAYRITIIKNVSQGGNFYFDNMGNLVRT